MKVVEYDPSRRADVADLMGRVWGERPDEEELAWFYEENPGAARLGAARRGGREDGRHGGDQLRPMSIGGERLEVGMPLRVATDPDYRGRGIFAELQAANEERVRGLGVRLLLTVPNAASTPVFLDHLGWSAAAVAPRLVAVAARERPAARERRRALRPRAAPLAGRRRPGASRRRLAELALRRLADPLHAARRRRLRGRRPPRTARRGRRRRGRPPRRRSAAAGAPVADRGAAAVAAPALHPRGATSRRTGRFTLLGKSLQPGQAVPAQPHFELGDLDFL